MPRGGTSPPGPPDLPREAILQKFIAAENSNIKVSIGSFFHVNEIGTLDYVLGNSMSNQHEKNLTPSDLNKTLWKGLVYVETKLHQISAVYVK